MAIKERLLKQLQIVWDGLNAMPPFHSRDLNAMRNALVQARDLCFRGLPEKSFAAYKDTYDGLLLAIDQLAANAPDKEEVVSLCSELLQYTIAQTQKETTFKKEIFFLPYKASMWDSLESVWKAADEDKEHCIAYVMPIPYADLTPEHTVAEWHCERDLFPNDVPTIDWQTVDLEEMHPDVIFIHNPYDEYNRVTSVESRYYSRNLKKCTDKLVYIPYFVLEEISPGNEAAEGGISGFILTPAVLNADEVIVQSEDMRQVYINVLIRNTDQKDRAYWEKRILGLGSPKIEKVLTSKKEDFELPEAWAKIVKGKKIILYNTSLNAMLQNSDKVCEKLRYVFNIFKNRKDVALWWRPHPLMKSTIHSMRPEIEEEYCQIERQYIKEGWGVYDDTGDLHRAIAWSDAYYGDGSSVVQLYKNTNKIVSFQNINNNIQLILSRNISVNGEGAFFIDALQGIIYEVDIISGTCRNRIYIPECYITTIRSYAMISDVGSKLIILPEREQTILEYDKEKREFCIAFVLEKRHSLSRDSLFKSYVEYKKKKYFISHQQGWIIEYNCETHLYTFLQKQWELIKENLSELEYKMNMELGWLGYSHVYQKLLIIPISNTDNILFVDMDTNKMHLQYLKNIKNLLWITNYKEQFYFLFSNGDVFEYQYVQGGFSDSYRKIYSHGRPIYCPYFFVECYHGKLCLYPGTNGDIKKISIENGVIIKKEKTKQVFRFIQRTINNLWMAISVGPTGNYLHIKSTVDKERLIIIKPEFNEKRKQDIINIILNWIHMIYLNEEDVSLKLIIDSVIAYNAKPQKKQDVFCGYEIYSSLIR